MKMTRRKKSARGFVPMPSASVSYASLVEKLANQGYNFSNHRLVVIDVDPPDEYYCGVRPPDSFRAEGDSYYLDITGPTLFKLKQKAPGGVYSWEDVAQSALIPLIVIDLDTKFPVGYLEPITGLPVRVTVVGPKTREQVLSELKALLDD